MTIERIATQAARDREAIVAYLVEVAGAIASGRTKIDPFGIVVLLVGTDGIDVGSRGMVYEHNYLAALDVLTERLTAIRKRVGRACWVCGAERPPRINPPGPPAPPAPWGCSPEHMAEARRHPGEPT